MVSTDIYDLTAISEALKTANENRRHLKAVNEDLNEDLTTSENERRRLRREREEARSAAEELRTDLATTKKELSAAHKHIEKLRRELERVEKHEERKFSDEDWKAFPVPLYKKKVVVPKKTAVPKKSALRNSRPMTPGASASGQRRATRSNGPTPTYCEPAYEGYHEGPPIR